MAGLNALIFVMEKLRMTVNKIAYTPLSQALKTLSPSQISLIPLLSLASSLYGVALFFRRRLYHLGLLRQHRLPVPVISVGNLTWGGNGKTPMVEFLARWLDDSGTSPLILTRGYGGGDEARMLQRHLSGTSAKIGVGADRAATAASFFERHGYRDPHIGVDHKSGTNFKSDGIGVVILDDGMQHLSLYRDLEIVMVNGMFPWGNKQLLPLGPLREPLTALCRADIVIINHADLASVENTKVIELMIRNIKELLPIVLMRMVPSHFFNPRNASCQMPLRSVHNMIVLCVSAIGFANAFVQGIRRIGPLHVDQLDFSDHHQFQLMDMQTIGARLHKLQAMFGSKPIIVITEKDYDREPEIFKQLDPFEVLVLCSQLQVVSREGQTEDCFKMFLRELLKSKSVNKNST